MAFNSGGAVSGAASGATAGSSFGPWGTAIGAVVGGLAGGLMGGDEGMSSIDARRQAQTLRWLAAQDQINQGRLLSPYTTLGAQSAQIYGGLLTGNFGLDSAQQARFDDLSSREQALRARQAEIQHLTTKGNFKLDPETGEPILDNDGKPIPVERLRNERIYGNEIAQIDAELQELARLQSMQDAGAQMAGNGGLQGALEGHPLYQAMQNLGTADLERQYAAAFGGAPTASSFAARQRGLMSSQNILNTFGSLADLAGQGVQTGLSASGIQSGAMTAGNNNLMTGSTSLANNAMNLNMQENLANQQNQIAGMNALGGAIQEAYDPLNLAINSYANTLTDDDIAGMLGTGGGGSLASGSGLSGSGTQGPINYGNYSLGVGGY